MAHTMHILVNGLPVLVAPGTTVAGALAQAGIVGFRRSIMGESRGPLCGMGVCMECRVMINGQAQCRSCQALCQPGMEVRTDGVSGTEFFDTVLIGRGRTASRAAANPESVRDSRAALANATPAGPEPGPAEAKNLVPRLPGVEPALKFEIVVVGAGPAGLAAATVAAESGRRVALVDDTPWLGGQIWRGQQAQPSIGQARRWMERFGKSNAALLDSTSVIAAAGQRTLLAEHPRGPRRIEWERLVLATGARELFLPFPGWTLPGVFGPGGLQSLVKQGWPIKGARAVVAGSGPLLLAVAAGLRQQGAAIVSINEQAPWSSVLSFGLGLMATPGKFFEALDLKRQVPTRPYRCGVWPVAAGGDVQVRAVTLTNGRRTWTEECDVLACGFGLVPNLELPLALGCQLNDGFVRVDPCQASTVAGVYCAGELTGIGGADCALVEGQIAGHAAGGRPEAANGLLKQRGAWHGFRAMLAKTFALRGELKRLAAPETVVCRCEDVTCEKMKEFSSWRDAKLQTRCGMGACQGRVCGAAAKVIFGWGMESVRPPILPARVESLMGERGERP